MFKIGSSVKLSKQGIFIRLDEMRDWTGIVLDYDVGTNKYLVSWGGARRWWEPEDFLEDNKDANN